MIDTKLSVEQRLQKAVSDIMMNPKYIALAGIMTLGERGVKDSVPTACTNGKDEWYGRGFVESLSDPELRFLILHEVNKLIEESKAKASEDRKKRASIDQRNNALTLVAQAERRLRDASLELGPYGAERQQRSVEIAMRDVEDMLDDNDLQELEYAVGSLQEALFGLNRRLSAERKTESNPIQGIKNTFGSLKDELFSDDYWDDDPWDYSQRGQNQNNDNSYRRRDIDPWDNDYYR